MNFTIRVQVYLGAALQIELRYANGFGKYSARSAEENQNWVFKFCSRNLGPSLMTVHVLFLCPNKMIGKSPNHPSYPDVNRYHDKYVSLHRSF
jgi:hypothetical protein